MSLEQRRGEAASHLDELRRQRGAALLDAGHTTENLELVLGDVAREVEALDDAINEEGRRLRAAQVKAAESRLASLRARLADAEAARLQAVAKAEAGSWVTASALSEVLNITREINLLIGAIGGSRPVPLSVPETERRFAGRISTVLKSVTGRSDNRFGNLELKPIPFEDDPTIDWRAREEREGARCLAPFLNPSREIPK
jgi:hypothetical protein